MTRDVKAAAGGRAIEIVDGESYNRPVSTARISGHFLLALVVSPLLVGAACEKKTPKPNDTGAVTAADRAATPPDTSPIPGLDTSKLDADKQKLFFALASSLNSPCGKAENLRQSFLADKTCKRAPFAIKFVLMLVEDENQEKPIREAYAQMYESKDPPHKVDIAKAPRVGNDDAPIRIIEFYDYSCHVCQAFKPALDEVAEKYGEKVVFYFMMYPLGQWPDSKSAGQAAIAAAQQGKFKEMHAILFARAPQHSKELVMRYAAELGLDLAKFEADYTAAAAQVDRDHAEGEKVGVKGTPTVLFNERKLDFLRAPKHIGMWIEEELAVNR